MCSFYTSKFIKIYMRALYSRCKNLRFNLTFFLKLRKYEHKGLKFQHKWTLYVSHVHLSISPPPPPLCSYYNKTVKTGFAYNRILP